MKNYHLMTRWSFVKIFCYVLYRLNASGGNVAAVTARTRIECTVYNLDNVSSYFLEKDFC